MEESLIGFQLRLAIEELKPWDINRKTNYLLYDNIQRPLSVDQAVWPICNNDKIHQLLFSDYCRGVNVSPNSINVFTIKNISILHQSSSYEETFLIGISILNNSIDDIRKYKSDHFIIDNQYSIELLIKENWKCIGYDVADSWLTSGLMNCGYDTDYKINLINAFHASVFNRYGLFNSIEFAKEFRINCDSRIREHSPFYIYGIWFKNDLY